MESWKQTLAELAAQRLVSLKHQAFLLCGDNDQADDLVQEALVRAFARPLRAPRLPGAEAYVRVIMVNVFIDAARRRSRWRKAMPLLDDGEAVADLTEAVVDRGVVLAALDGLSPRQRACVVLRYYEDLPLAEVAAALGVAEGTVKRYLGEAMARLAEVLSPAGSRAGSEAGTDES